jgi:hypothetical protein
LDAARATTLSPAGPGVGIVNAERYVDPPNGVMLPAPAAITPGTARSRASTASTNAALPAASSVAPVTCTVATSTLAGS